MCRVEFLRVRNPGGKLGEPGPLGEDVGETRESMLPQVQARTAWRSKGESLLHGNGCGRPSETARWRPADAAHSRPSRHAGCWRRGTRQPCRCRHRPAHRGCCRGSPEPWLWDGRRTARSPVQRRSISSAGLVIGACPGPGVGWPPVRRANPRRPNLLAHVLGPRRTTPTASHQTSRPLRAIASARATALPIPS